MGDPLEMNDSGVKLRSAQENGAFTWDLIRIVGCDSINPSVDGGVFGHGAIVGYRPASVVYSAAMYVLSG